MNFADRDIGLSSNGTRRIKTFILTTSATQSSQCKWSQKLELHPRSWVKNLTIVGATINPSPMRVSNVEATASSTWLAISREYLQRLANLANRLRLEFSCSIINR